MARTKVNYRGRHAIVTGASSGLGVEFARELAKRGAHLSLVARREPELKALAEDLRRQYGVDAEAISMDLSAAHAAEQLQARVPHADILVNNAGFGTSGTIEAQNDEGRRRTIQEIQLNVAALTDLTQRYVPGMVAQSFGIVINVASTAGFQPVPHMAVYGATKAFVLSFTQALAAELDGTGVRVRALCPGPTATSFFDVANASTPFGRIRKPEQVIATAFAGISDDKTVVVDGATNLIGSWGGRHLPASWTMAVAGRMFSR